MDSDKYTEYPFIIDWSRLWETTPYRQPPEPTEESIMSPELKAALDKIIEKLNNAEQRGNE